MSLPCDYARCSGVQDDGEWREGCEDCLRRTSPGHPTWQTMMAPPKMITPLCENRIGPEDRK